MIEIVTKTASLGGFFKAADHLDAKALLIEPKRVELGQVNNFGNTVDYVYCDIAEFNTADMLTGSQEPNIMRGTRVENKPLTRELVEGVGKGYIFKVVTRQPSKPGQKAFSVFESVDPAVQEAVVEYVKRREEKQAAKADDLPDFLK